MGKVNINPKIRQQINKKAANEKIPLNGIFELTPLCNMDCEMCFIRMSEEEMKTKGKLRSAKEWIGMGKECADAGMLFLLITGGEPFLRKDFREIYTEINKMGVMISINSNGTMIDEETVKWLKKAPPTVINITMYGSSNETYKRVCHNTTGYDKVVRAVDMLIEAGINVRINASFTPNNIKDMEGIYSFAKERNIKVRPTIYMFPPLRKKESINQKGEIDNVRFSPEEAGKAMFNTKIFEMGEKSFKLLLKLKQKTALNTNDDECFKNPSDKLGCYAGKCFFWITWDGRMLPCGMMNDPVAYPFEEGFEESWKSIVKESEKMQMPQDCLNCKNKSHCKVCMAVVKAETNGRGKPEYLCRMTDVYQDLCDSCLVKREN